MLYLEHVKKIFGGNEALSDVSFTINQSDFVGLIGPNGSGKTTLINCISGLLVPTSGKIRFENRSIIGLSPPKIYRMGIGRTFQISKVFGRLSVYDNLRIPSITIGKTDEREIRRKSESILSSLHLESYADVTANSLSGGQKKLLELGMIMMSEPQILLLDEPFGGVHPELKKQFENYLSQLNSSGKTIILVSHEMSTVFRICPRLVVLDRGVVVADGSPSEIQSNDRVVKAYLGGKHGH